MPRRLALVALLIFAAAALVLSGVVSARTHTKPRLRLVKLTPLVVRGASFRKHERIRVRVVGPYTAARTVIATVGGTFVATFPPVASSRCERSEVTVTAVGNAGSVAVAKVRPQPDCPPGLGP
jgi:hypothetical protein